MATSISEKTPRRKGFWAFLRTLGQRAPNRLPTGAIPLVLPHEDLNHGNLAMPLTETRFVTKEPLQSLSYFASAVFLAEELGDTFKEKPNLVLMEALAYTQRLAQEGPGSEAPNERNGLLTLVAQDRAIDQKWVPDWDATPTNKESIPTLLLDPATAQRAKFIRYQLQHGIYNEGFTSEEGIPLQYHTYDDFVLSDAKDHDMYDKYPEDDAATPDD